MSYDSRDNETYPAGYQHTPRYRIHEQVRAQTPHGANRRIDLVLRLLSGKVAMAPFKLPVRLQAGVKNGSILYGKMYGKKVSIPSMCHSPWDAIVMIPRPQ